MAGIAPMPIAAVCMLSKHTHGRVLTCCNVLQHSCQVDGGASSNALGVLALLQEAGDAAHGELQAGLGAARHCLLATCGFAATTSGCCLACHFRIVKGSEENTGIEIDAVLSGALGGETQRPDQQAQVQNVATQSPHNRHTLPLGSADPVDGSDIFGRDSRRHTQQQAYNGTQSSREGSREEGGSAQ